MHATFFITRVFPWAVNIKTNITYNIFSEQRTCRRFENCLVLSFISCRRMRTALNYWSCLQGSLQEVWGAFLGKTWWFPENAWMAPRCLSWSSPRRPSQWSPTSQNDPSGRDTSSPLKGAPSAKKRLDSSFEVLLPSSKARWSSWCQRDSAFYPPPLIPLSICWKLFSLCPRSCPWTGTSGEHVHDHSHRTRSPLQRLHP